MIRSLFVAAMVASLVACAADPGEGKPAATVSDVPAVPAEATPATPVAPVAATLATPAGATQLTVDSAKSTIGAVGAKITAQHPITFAKFEGKVGLDGEVPAGFSFIVDMSSLFADDQHLTDHLKGDDFFDIAKFPSATFVSTEVKAGSDTAGMTHTVTGDLTLRGTTKRVTFPAKITVAADSVDANTEFSVNRKDFNIVYPGKPDDLIKDNVLLKIALHANRA